MLKFVSQEPIKKGWSSDKKYCVKDEMENQYFLRVSSMEQYNQKR